MTPPCPTADPVALVSARALGDGLLALTLAENLRRAGRRTVLYHSQLTEMAAWFPSAAIAPLPEGRALDALLRDAPAWFLGDRTLASEDVLAGSGKERLVFGKDRWDRERPYLRSLAAAAQEAFALTWSGNENGLVPPDPSRPRAHPRRICIHPTSARPAKNWSARNFVALADRLADSGYEPVFLLAPGEEDAWRAAAGATHAYAVPGTLDAVAAWLYGSGAAITTDSGIGHLASNVGLPTLALFRKRSASRFWAPAWSRVRVVTAPVRLPGKAGHRHWDRLLRPGRVARAFEALMDSEGGSSSD